MVTNKNSKKPHIKCNYCGNYKDYFSGGYCNNCYKNSNANEVLNRYLKGENLPEIGSSKGFSRERARQLLNIAIKTERSNSSLSLTDDDLKEAIIDIKKTSRENRVKFIYGKLIDTNYTKYIQLLKNSDVTTENRMLAELKLPPRVIGLIESEYKELINIIHENNKKWSRKYKNCRNCGTTKQKHKYWGYCVLCYTRTKEWRELQSKYRKKSLEKK